MVVKSELIREVKCADNLHTQFAIRARMNEVMMSIRGATT
jgi:hypothetical protein